MNVRSAKGFSLAELLIVIAIFGIVAVIAVPGLLRARTASNEASAIASLRVIHSAEAAYASTCAMGGYAARLADLAKAPTGAFGYISPDLGADPSIKSGYIITLTAASGAIKVKDAANTCNASANDAMNGFYATAIPVTLSTTGSRSFATDSRGTIFFAAGAAPPPEPLTASATVVALQ